MSNSPAPPTPVSVFVSRELDAIPLTEDGPLRRSWTDVVDPPGFVTAAALLRARKAADPIPKHSVEE